MTNTSTPQNGLVSIVCPTFNASKYIAKTIDSVICQSYTDWELLLVDDSSTDDTVSCISPYLSDDRIRLFRNMENLGSAATRNIAIDNSNGRYVAFLDSDDLWEPNKLEIQIEFMHSTDSPFSFTEYTLIDVDGATIGASQRLPRAVNYESLLLHCVIQNSTAIYDTHAFGKVYSPPLRKRQDFGLFLNILRTGSIARLVTSVDGEPIRLAKYRIHRASISSNKLKNIPYQWAIYREFENLSFLRSCYLTTNWILRAGYKNAIRRLAKY